MQTLKGHAPNPVWPSHKMWYILWVHLLTRNKFASRTHKVHHLEFSEKQFKCYSSFTKWPIFTKLDIWYLWTKVCKHIQDSMSNNMTNKHSRGCGLSHKCIYCKSATDIRMFNEMWYICKHIHIYHTLGTFLYLLIWWNLAQMLKGVSLANL